MRINKYLADQGHTTRRGADELIKKKKVLINGKPAVLGDQVEEGDNVEIIGIQANKKTLFYYAYNKPKGVITHSPQGEEIDIKESSKLQDIFPVGRLDKSSHGLIILTNDGRITDRLLNPDRSHEKEYIVKTTRRVTPGFQAKMEAGVNIEGYITKPCQIEVLDPHTFKITLTEGKKHQIRRMCVALHNEVKDLQRVRIMNIRLGSLKPNEFRPIKDKELRAFLTALGL